MLPVISDYFTVFNERGKGGNFPTDVGILVGLFTWGHLSGEVGVDYYAGFDNPWVFNGKIGMKEDLLSCWSPSWSIGVFNVGTKRGVTDNNVIDLLVGHSLPKWIGGNLYFGGYTGNRSVGSDQSGFMVGYFRAFCHIDPDKDSSKADLSVGSACSDTDDDDESSGYDKWLFIADYASGRNLVGGGGASLVYYFTPDISMQTGPVFFNTNEFCGKWKWSVQIFFDFDLFNPDGPFSPWKL